MSPRTLAGLQAAGRLAIGASLVVAPQLLGGGWVGSAADRRSGQVLAIGLGARDVALAVGTLQALLSESEEFGLTPGLGIFEGQVRRFPDTLPASTTRLKVPHMGWNQLQQQRACPLLAGIPDGTFAYFVHSYYAAPKDAAAVVATTDYGVEFASVLWRDNLYATQFHPEKSQHWGLRILQNFFVLSQGKTACR